MPPIRRYLRITQYSVLEVRIYLDRPSDTSWLLSSRTNILPRIIAAVRPKVLPKLREENENAARKKGSGSRGKKQKGIKDVVAQEDFEATIFLTETSTRHSLLTKRKGFREKGARLRSNGKGLAGGGAAEDPIEVEDEDGKAEVVVRREEDDDEDVQELQSIPVVEAGGKRKAVRGGEEGDDGLFVSSSDEDFFQTQRERRTKARRKGTADLAPEQEQIAEADDKKKMALNTSYDGFSIYGRILCLVVKRKGKKTAQTGAAVATAAVGGSQMMEQWVSTQAAQEMGLDEND